MNKEPSTLQRLGLAIWSFLLLLGRAILKVVSFVANYRETTIFPIVLGIVIFLFGFIFMVWTGHKLLNDVGAIVDMLINLAGIVAVIAVVGALKTKGFLLSDIEDENDPATPWQKVAFSDFAFVVLVCFLSWLVLSQ